MFACHNCKSIFEEPNINAWVEPHGEKWVEWCCPECGSTDFVESQQCEVCMEENDPDQMVAGVCYWCRQDLLTDADCLSAFASEDEYAYIEFCLDLRQKKKKNANGSASAESV